MKTPAPEDHTRFPISRLLLGVGFAAIASAILMMCLLIGSATRAMAAPASPVSLELSVKKEQRGASADGTTTIDLVPIASITPGDRLVYILTYTNTGATPVADMVLNYPLPAGITYRAAADGSLPPQLSSDGVNFTPSTPEKPVTTLRWQVPGAIAPGAHGTVSFKAALN